MEVVVKYLVFLFFIFWGSCVFAANWQYLGETKEFSIQLDTDSIKKVNSSYGSYGTGITQFWIKRTVINDLSKDGLGLGDYMMMLFHINCNQDTLGVKTAIKYKMGTVIDNYSQSLVVMEAIVPDSLGAEYSRAVCNN